MFRARWSVGGGLAFAMALVFSPAPLLAQWSPSNKHALLYSGYNAGYYASPGGVIPPAAKGYQVTRMVEQRFLTADRGAAASMPVPRYTPAPEPVPSALEVGINPPPSKPITVAIRGPDGKVRNFPLASPDAIQPRTVIVRAGERLRITLSGTVRVQLQRK
jgi:hypothetical protein